MQLFRSFYGSRRSIQGGKSWHAMCWSQLVGGIALVARLIFIDLPKDELERLPHGFGSGLGTGVHTAAMLFGV
jgi:hypothetical protein